MSELEEMSQGVSVTYITQSLSLSYISHVKLQVTWPVTLVWSGASRVAAAAYRPSVTHSRPQHIGGRSLCHGRAEHIGGAV